MNLRLNSLLFLFLSALFLLPACENDFDVTAEWEDVTVVYGLLSQNDSTHYIRVSKAFLGEGNALRMAEEFDSLYYDNNLQVTIEEWDENEVNKLNTYTLERIIADNKKPGIFASPEHVLYTFKQELDQKYIYKLVINNEKRDKLITAKTPMVHSFSIEKPALNHPTEPTIHFPPNDLSKEVAWRTSQNGKRYEVLIRFYYREQLDGEPMQDTSVIWSAFPVKKADIVSGAAFKREKMEFTIVNQSFYSFVKERVLYENATKENRVLGRYADSLVFEFSVAADEFNTYLELNNASGLLEERPEYSNIQNGIGLFSSRYKQKRRFYFHPLTKKELADRDELKFVVE